jgi:hypothetical protein
MGEHEAAQDADSEAAPNLWADGAPDSVATAALGLAANQARRGGDDRLDTFLERQSRVAEKQIGMLDLQMEHLHQERELAHRHQSLKFFGDQLKVGLQLLAIAFGALVVVGLGALVWSSAHSKGLVIDAFDVPPELAARGLTGKVMAAQLQDRLTAMQAETVSPLEARQASKSAAEEIKIEIPETGVSLGEANRLLRQWLGHETHVTGEVVRGVPTDGGPVLSMTVRAGEEPGASSTGPDAQMDRLVGAAAEAIYARSQPFQYVLWLTEHGREREAQPILRRIAARGNDVDRGQALVMLAASDPSLSLAQQLDMLRQASRIDPENPTIWLALGNTERAVGHSEASLRDESQAAAQSARQRGFSTAGARLLNLYARGNEQLALGAIADSLRLSDEGRRIPNVDSGAAINALASASRFVLLHDVQGARKLAAATPPPGAGMPEQARLAFQARLAAGDVLEDEALEDWASEAAHYAHWKALAAVTANAESPAGLQLNDAYALARLGHQAEAEAIVGVTPLDCYACVIERGRIAAVKKDWASANRWFAIADAQGPSLPQAPTRWGQALLDKGDVAGAIAKLKLAHQRGPHYADPLKLWGEALLRQGDAAGAIAKFAEANEYASRWGGNHMLWGEALARMGRTAEAKAQYKAAAGMDLSASDRATLVQLQRQGGPP